MHINAAVKRVRMPAVDAEGKLFAREYHPCRTREQRQQIKLRRGCFDQPSSTMHNARAIIEFEIAQGNPFGGWRFTWRLDETVFRPSKNGVDSRDKFERIAGLRQIIIRAEFQAKYAIGVAAARGHDQQWRLRARAQTAQHFKSADPRQPDIQKDQGVGASSYACQSLLSAMHAVERETLRLKMFPHRFT